MNLTLVSPPVALPVNIDDVKAFCRVEDTDNDSLLTTFMNSAVELAENETSRRFMQQQWQLDLDSFKDQIWLPYPSLLSVDSVSYYDSTNVLQTLDSSFYNVDGMGNVGCITLAYGYSYPATYPRPDALKITYTCGYSSLSAVPQSLKDAIATMVWFLFDGRGEQLDKPFLNFLLGPHIMRGFYEP